MILLVYFMGTVNHLYQCFAFSFSCGESWGWTCNPPAGNTEDFRTSTFGILILAAFYYFSNVYVPIGPRCFLFKILYFMQFFKKLLQLHFRMRQDTKNLNKIVI